MGAPEKVDQSTPWTAKSSSRICAPRARKLSHLPPLPGGDEQRQAHPEQIQGWVCNRFYYQIAIPIKDAAILSNMPDRDHRRQWIQRILDHDGTQGDEGGIEAWLRWARPCGLEREEVTSLRHVLARRALRRRCVHQFRTARAVAGSSLLELDRAVRTGDPQGAAGQLAAALSVDRSEPVTPTSASACRKRAAM